MSYYLLDFCLPCPIISLTFVYHVLFFTWPLSISYFYTWLLSTMSYYLLDFCLRCPIIYLTFVCHVLLFTWLLSTMFYYLLNFRIQCPITNLTFAYPVLLYIFPCCPLYIWPWSTLSYLCLIFAHGRCPNNYLTFICASSPIICSSANYLTTT